MAPLRCMFGYFNSSLSVLQSIVAIWSKLNTISTCNNGHQWRVFKFHDSSDHSRTATLEQAQPSPIFPCVYISGTSNVAPWWAPGACILRSLTYMYTRYVAMQFRAPRSEISIPDAAYLIDETFLTDNINLSSVVFGPSKSWSGPP
jgi:hypothetical protein